MNEELNKKLAKWADIKPFLSETYSKKELRQFFYDHTPCFTESLDACFKWLVPKLIRDGFSVNIYYLNGSGEYDDNIWHAHVGCDDYNIVIYTENNEPALALCLAIEELLMVWNEINEE